MPLPHLRGRNVQEVVEDGELLGCLGETYLLALAVVGDYLFPQTGQRLDGYRDAAHVASGPAFPGNRPPEDEAIILLHFFGEIAEGFVEDPRPCLFGEHESTFHSRPGRTRADRLRAGAAAEEHLQGRGQKRLAGPCFAGDHIEAGREPQGGLFDQGHVLDGKLRKHYRNVLRTARHQLQSSVRPILTLSSESLISTLPSARISRGSAPSSESSASLPTSCSSAT